MNTGSDGTSQDAKSAKLPQGRQTEYIRHRGRTGDFMILKVDRWLLEA